MRKSVLVDTGIFVALFDKHDEYHARALDFVKQFRGRFITNAAVLTETVYLLDFHIQAQLSFLRWIASGAVSILPIEQPDIVRAAELMDRFQNVPMDLADASLVALAEKTNIRQIATLDSDFTIYRLPHGKSFDLVFRKSA